MSTKNIPDYRPGPSFTILSESFLVTKINSLMFVQHMPSFYIICFIVANQLQCKRVRQYPKRERKKGTSHCYVKSGCVQKNALFHLKLDCFPPE